MSLRVPTAVYVANLFFAATLSAGVRVWIPIVLAEGLAVPIVPVGFAYETGPKWRVAMRFGAPVLLANRGEIEPVRARVETDVIALSQSVARGV